MCIALGVASAAALFLGLLTFGKYTIGGALNSWQDRIVTLIVWAALAWLWFVLIDNSPLSLSVKAAQSQAPTATTQEPSHE